MSPILLFPRIQSVTSELPIAFYTSSLSRMRLTGTVPPTKEAVDVVLGILKGFPEGAGTSTKDIYRLATPKAPRKYDAGKRQKLEAPENPVRSVSYLKNTVLRTLEHKRFIEKISVKPSITSSAANPEAHSQTPPATNDAKATPHAPLKLTWIWRVCNQKASHTKDPVARTS
ncbi:hypothetical protein DFH11DRAFT_1273767 [Phellopilus nigrolimitatus]|nr:hypothetical protein DFH11DRAFT_1273767 [Phellopilus nigrolimitatus]